MMEKNRITKMVRGSAIIILMPVVLTGTLIFTASSQWRTEPDLDNETYVFVGPSKDWKRIGGGVGDGYTNPDLSGWTIAFPEQDGKAEIYFSVPKTGTYNIFFRLRHSEGGQSGGQYAGHYNFTLDGKYCDGLAWIGKEDNPESNNAMRWAMLQEVRVSEGSHTFYVTVTRGWSLVDIILLATDMKYRPPPGVRITADAFTRAARPKLENQVLAVNDDYILWLESPLRKVGKNDTAEMEKKKPDSTINISAARNEYEPFQIVLRPRTSKPINGARIEISDLVSGQSKGTIGAKNIKCERVGYKYPKSHSAPRPYLDPGCIDSCPDPLLPEERFDAIKEENCPLWVTVYVPPDTKPGKYTGTIRLITDSSVTATMELVMNVWDFAIPREQSLPTSMGINLTYIEEKHKIEDPAVMKEMIEKYMVNFAEHRMSPFTLPSSWSELKHTMFSDLSITRELDGSFSIDFSKMDRRMEHLFELGMAVYPVGMPPDYYDKASGRKKGFGPEGRAGAPWEGPFDKDGVEVMKQLCSHLKEKGWLGRTYVYTRDEPLPEYFPDMKKAADLYHESCPELQLMSPITDYLGHPLLVGAMDIWCPIINKINMDKARELQESGDKVWCYTCCQPREAYPNVFMDYSAVQQRVIFWLIWRYKLDGFLFWHTNLWIKEGDPWSDSYVNPMGDEYPAGDGMLLYYGKDGPVNSIRWELLREGLEDYEYFVLLQNLVREAKGKKVSTELIGKAGQALKSVDMLAKNWTEYCREPAEYFKVREQIGSLIQDLGRSVAGEK